MSSRFHPHRALVREIAHALLVDGVYSIELFNPSPQQLTDLHWCALAVGRQFRIRTRLTAERSPDAFDKTVTVTIERDDGVTPGAIDSRAQLEDLLRAVERNHLRVVRHDE